MDEFGQILSQGTLSDLTRMEQRAEQLAEQQGALYEQLTSLQELQARVVQLRVKRDQLKAETGLPKTGPLSLLQQHQSKDGAESEQLKELRMKKHQLEEKKAAYRLLGQSLTVVDRRTVRLCIDTCYNGEYAAPHYVEIRLGPDGGSLTRHTLPPYVPLENTKKMLQTGLTEFTKHVQMYLQAHIARKGFVQTVQEEHADMLTEDIQTTPSVDWVKVTLRSVPQCSQAQMTLQLKYDDLSSWLPTRVKVTIQARESDDEESTQKNREDVANIVTLLKKNDLPSAIIALIG